MDEDVRGPSQLGDAALVHSVHRRIGEAVAALAVRPLDEPAAAQMRAALGSQGSARAAIARLQAAERPGGTGPAVVTAYTAGYTTGLSVTGLTGVEAASGIDGRGELQVTDAPEGAW